MIVKLIVTGHSSPKKYIKMYSARVGNEPCTVFEHCHKELYDHIQNNTNDFPAHFDIDTKDFNLTSLPTFILNQII